MKRKLIGGRVSSTDLFSSVSTTPPVSSMWDPGIEGRGPPTGVAIHNEGDTKGLEGT